MAGADVVVRFIGDSKQLTDDMAKVEGQTSKLGNAFTGMAKTVVTAFAGIQIARFAQDAVQGAQDMAESQSKLKNVFEDSTAEIRAHIIANDRLVSAYLGGRQAATDAAGSFGNMFQQMGFGAEQTLAFSKGLLTLTADLVSFHNADPTEVIQAIGATFRGEFDSVQKWVPTITAAAVENRALADSGKAVAAELTTAEKVAATYALLIEGAGKATGDAADTFDSSAGKTRAMKDQLAEMELQIGQALLPVLDILVPKIAALAEAFTAATPSIQNGTLALAGFGAVAVAVGGPIGAIVLGIGLLIVQLGLLWANWDQVWTWVQTHSAYASVIALLLPVQKALFDLVLVAKFVQAEWEGVWNRVSGAVDNAWARISGTFDAIGAGAARVVDTVVGFFAGLDNKILNAAGDLYSVGRRIMQDLLNGIESLAGSVLNKVKDIGGSVAGALNPFGSPKTKAYYTGQNAVKDYLEGVQSQFPKALQVMTNYGGALTPALAGNTSSATYNINVAVAAGTNPANVGAATVDAIRAYERQNGKSWRET